MGLVRHCLTIISALAVTPGCVERLIKDSGGTQDGEMTKASSRYLLRHIHLPRIAGWLLVSTLLLFAWLKTGCQLYLGISLVCLVFPHLLHVFLRHGSDSKKARYSMLVDAGLTGYVIGVLGFPAVEALVLVTMLLVSVLIVGGLRLGASAVVVASTRASASPVLPGSKQQDQPVQDHALPGRTLPA